MAANKGVEDDGAICRICFLGDRDNALIKVCRCRGSVAFVHQSCINEWVEKSRNLDCMCGYRMTMDREKQKLTIKERIRLSFEEFKNELRTGWEWRIVRWSIDILLVVDLMINLFIWSDFLLNEGKMWLRVMRLSHANLVFWHFMRTHCLVFLYLFKVIICTFWRLMLRDRYKWVVKAIK